MDRTERFYRIEQLIRARGCVSFAALLDELGVSRATLKRDLEYLRSRLHAPIAYDRLDNGYRFAAADPQAPAHELPGLWFSEREIHALLTMHGLLAGLGADGLLGRHLQPLLERLHALLGDGRTDAQALVERIRVLGAATRPVPARFFEAVASALLGRRQVRLRYYTRARRATSERVVSPQRLTHHRHTWYLDAWCHRSEGLRRFALDAVREAELLDSPARELPLATVRAALDAGYGVFAGGTQGLHWARIRFTAEAAQWVAAECWHPQQQGHALDDGGWELRVPYADPTELVMDVLRHGEQAEVLEPAALRRQVAARLAAAAGVYAAS